MNEVEVNLTNERIGFWMRFGAYMIDFAFVMLFGIMLGVLFGEFLAPAIFGETMAQMEMTTSTLPHGFQHTFNRIMEIASGTSLVGLILIVLEGATGQSIGKMFLKIINTNEDGSPASAQTLWLRAGLKYGASILSFIGSISGLWFISSIGSLWSLVIFVGFFLVFMDNKQTIHDMIAKTVVSRK